MKISGKLLLFSYVFLLYSCKDEVKFDSSGWFEKNDGFYTKRELMVNDVLKNKLKKDMNFNEVVTLLGKPDYDSFEKDGEIHYEIHEKYKWNIDPEEIRYLDIRFNDDSLLVDSKIRITK